MVVAFAARGFRSDQEKGGRKVFVEVGKHGTIPLGGAVKTSAGRLSYKAIIHVVVIDMFWRSSEKTIRSCVRSAMEIALKENFNSVAFPVIGSGSGGFGKGKALEIMVDEFKRIDSDIKVMVVMYG